MIDAPPPETRALGFALVWLLIFVFGCLLGMILRSLW